MLDRFDKLRILRWTDRIQRILAGERLGPIRAQIDLTNLCSHQCFFCEPVEFREETIRDKKHTLPFQIVEKLLNDLKELDCQTIIFSGGGEPTLYPEFGAVLAIAKHLGFHVAVNTHGGRIERWPNLRRADVVRISLDATNDQEHMQMHHSRSGEFAKILEGIYSLVGHGPEVGISFIVSLINAKSLQAAVDLAEGLGVNYIHFKHLSGSNGIPVEYPTSKTVQVFHPQKRKRDVFEQRDFAKCYAALTLATIGANGDVSACCDRRDINFGNLHNQTFSDIWLGEEHRKIADKIIPQFCERCLLCDVNGTIEHGIVHDEMRSWLV